MLSEDYSSMSLAILQHDDSTVLWVPEGIE